MAGMSETPSGERIHVGFFGARNAGKSSLVNAVAGQELAVVSDTPGTTTDPVRKAMELAPVGPVLVIDTPGIDDAGDLGALRVAKAQRELDSVDVAVLVVDATKDMGPIERELEGAFKVRKIPYVVALAKSDLTASWDADGKRLAVSSLTGEGVDELKSAIVRLAGTSKPERKIVSDLIAPGDVVVLVIPIDESAPKGRIILPQQQVMRDAIEAGASACAVTPEGLPTLLAALAGPPSLVVTDSQAFGAVAALVPGDVPLTSFSILMARYKGTLAAQVEAVSTLDALRDGDRVLIAEGCSHHRQCDDIGTVKLPRWIRGITGAEPQFDFTSGGEFPRDVSPYRLIVHCGGCMLNAREMESRLRRAVEQGVPFTNYGMVIAKANGVLDRALAPLR